MKFRFLGGEDCPEWLGAEIATVAKISSVRIRILAKKIVQLCCLGDSGRELGKAEVAKAADKVRSGQDMSDGDVGAIFAVLHHVIASAAKFDVDGSTLSLELQQLGMPRELSDALVRPYSEARVELRDAGWRSTLRLPPLSLGKEASRTETLSGKEAAVLDLGAEIVVMSHAKLELLIHELRRAQESLQNCL